MAKLITSAKKKKEILDKLKPMSPFRELSNLMPAVGYIAGLSLVLNAVRDIFDVSIIKQFKLWSRYEIWIVRRKEVGKKE